MTKQALIKKLETMVDTIERTRMYGVIEIEFRAGRATFLTKKEQEKLDETGNRNDASYR